MMWARVGSTTADWSAHSAITESVARYDTRWSGVARAEGRLNTVPSQRRAQPSDSSHTPGRADSFARLPRERRRAGQKWTPKTVVPLF